MNYRVLSIILTAVASLVFCEAMCQNMPERRLVRKGNRQYEKGDFDTSLDSYARALQQDPNCFEAKFNTANGQFRKELIDKSEQTLRKLAQDSTRTDIERSEVAYNLGNTLFVQQRLEEALDCYRNAMRLNPDDKEAKFNYALTKELLKQQQNQQQQQQQNQDQQNQDQDQDQQNDQQDSENDDQKQDQKQDQNKDQNQDQNKDQNKDKPKQQPKDSESQPKITPQTANQMLQAIEDKEKETQEKVKKAKALEQQKKKKEKNW